MFHSTKDDAKDDEGEEKKDEESDFEDGALDDNFAVQTYQQVMKNNKFKYDGGKEGERSTYMKKIFEY